MEANNLFREDGKVETDDLFQENTSEASMLFSLLHIIKERSRKICSITVKEITRWMVEVLGRCPDSFARIHTANRNNKEL